MSLHTSAHEENASNPNSPLARDLVTLYPYLIDARRAEARQQATIQPGFAGPLPTTEKTATYYRHIDDLRHKYRESEDQITRITDVLYGASHTERRLDRVDRNTLLRVEAATESHVPQDDFLDWMVGKDLLIDVLVARVSSAWGDNRAYEEDEIAGEMERIVTEIGGDASHITPEDIMQATLDGRLSLDFVEPASTAQ